MNNQFEIYDSQKDALRILLNNGFTPFSDLNYCTDNGINYYIGWKGNEAAVCAIIEDDSLYLIEKVYMREMVDNAKVKGIESVCLFTNYGLELHSKHEKPQTVGFSKITKLTTQW